MPCAHCTYSTERALGKLYADRPGKPSAALKKSFVAAKLHARVGYESSIERCGRRILDLSASTLLYLVSAANLQLEIQLISSQFTDVTETALVILSLLTTSMVQVKLSVRCVCIIFRPHRMHGMQSCVTEVSRGLCVCMTSVAIGCISAIHAMLANNTNAYRLFGDMV